MQSHRKLLSPLAAAALTVLALAACAAVSARVLHPSVGAAGTGDIDATADLVNRFFERRWKEARLEPAEAAEELLVFRRLSLALCGAIPSLEEVRRFEADTQPLRLRRWTDKLLADDRFGDYFGRRLADAFLGNRDDDFPAYRYEHFVGWFGEQLQAGRPYDAVVRDIVAGQGFPTSHSAVNFLTAEIAQGDDFPNRLAARTVRAALGQRIDCAQCHDHPFDDWSQAQFEGLAAFYGQTRMTSFGVEDDHDLAFEVEDNKTLAKRTVEPRVPFEPAAMPDLGSRRERLAAWLTHPENRRFPRAIANRVWGLMFGRPYHQPVDDLPDPPPPGKADETELLDLLAADLESHEYDLRRTIRVIAASRPFRMASTHPRLESGETSEPLESAWAVFPLTRLRPEQLLGSMRQAASIKPLDPRPNMLARASRFKEQESFLREYGDAQGEDFSDQPANIPQTLLGLNGRFTRRLSGVNPMSGPGRIALFAASDAGCLETCYLACLSRCPTPAEQAHFLPQLQEARFKEKHRVVEDIFWTLFNSPEFSWSR